ncbi:glycosyltransferase family 2 protein [Burkholderia ubonensis]|uniref:glycosyltransferase family 2 protein n=1 Tax=Burkholderia ubonensis TaxID=101571 RepID=UPI000A5A5550|nr:glycosyltransferase [Burkholderia ubonensis]
MKSSSHLARCAHLLVALFLCAASAAAVLSVWIWLQSPQTAPDWDGKLAGVTYSGYRPGQDPQKARYPSDAQVREDMGILSRHTRRLRTYSSNEGPNTAAIAGEFGMDVTAGAWLVGRNGADRHELEGLVRNAKLPNVSRLLVGNEVLLRGDMSVEQLAAYIDEVKKTTHKPVSTAEPWTTWRDHPELAKHVDFIAVHLLPYWDEVPAAAAAEFSMQRLKLMQDTFPGKPIVVTETGYPSHGDDSGKAVASLQAETLYLRTFIPMARAAGADWYAMEAFDEPWKAASEGKVGMYWGLFDGARHLKISQTGTIWKTAGFPILATTVFILAAPFVLLAMYLARTWNFVCRLLMGITLFAGAAYVGEYALAFEGLYSASKLVLYGLLTPMTLLCIVVLWVQLFEGLEVLGRPEVTQLHRRMPLAAGEPEPFVSLHLACANEPPEMVIATLESFAALNYRNFEVLVVDNNTRDENLWRPVQAWVAEHAEHFRFWHLPYCPGFKAEALNHALEQTSARAQVIGVVDADYVVDANWLRDLVGHFAEAPVALVQAPQAHREFEKDRLARWAAFEFDGFFRVGMHHRNARNAIIQHGTMSLVRASVLRELGGWSTWTICEDAELGLRIMAAGHETRYVDEVFGRGLAPATFAAFRSQRRRWALGAMQILKGHAKTIFGRSHLTFAQRYHFVAGWLPWVSEAFQVVGSVVALAWTVGMALFPRVFGPPEPAMLVLVFIVPVFRAVMGLWLFKRKVGASWGDTLGAALASVALTYAIAEGVLTGLLGKHAAFIVTAKKKAGSATSLPAIQREIWLGTLLLAAAYGAVALYPEESMEVVSWTSVLFILSLPYLAGILMVGLTESRLDMFALPRMARIKLRRFKRSLT